MNISYKNISRLISELDMIKDQMEDMIMESNQGEGMKGENWDIARKEWKERGDWASNMIDDLRNELDIQYTNEIIQFLELNEREISILESHLPSINGKLALSSNYSNFMDDLEGAYSFVMDDLSDEYLINDSIILGNIINKIKVYDKAGKMDQFK